MFNLNKKLCIEVLESLYLKYNRREYVTPDPLQFLYNYRENRDIEIVALIAASLAYGNVKMILRSIEKILSVMGSPFDYTMTTTLGEMIKDFANFKHRFTKGEEIANLLFSVQNINKNFGSMYNLFYKIYLANKSATNINATVKIFFNEFFSNCPTLLANPLKGSACKRIHLFLRWMIRKDNVDLGIWENIDTSFLIIPLDTHMLNISNLLNFTKRKDNSIKTALEITEKFSELNYEDPVKYDFVLTRFGIRKMPLDFLCNQ